MQRYRKKPVVIMAQQFNGKDDADEIIRMTTGVREEQEIDDQGNIIPCLIIKTIEGEMRASLGWWVIVGVKGEVYACRHDIFEATYDPVTAEVPQ